MDPWDFFIDDVHPYAVAYYNPFSDLNFEVQSAILECTADELRGVFAGDNWEV